MATANKTKKTVKKKSPKEILNEKVPFHAIKDNYRYKDDIFVSVNGKTYQIQRGKTVHIPRFVKQALENTEKQKTVAADYSQGLVDQFHKNEKKLT